MSDPKSCECCGEPADSGYDPDMCMSCYGVALDAVDSGDW